MGRCNEISHSRVLQCARRRAYWARCQWGGRPSISARLMIETMHTKAEMTFSYSVIDSGLSIRTCSGWKSYSFTLEDVPVRVVSSYSMCRDSPPNQPCLSYTGQMPLMKRTL